MQFAEIINHLSDLEQRENTIIYTMEVRNMLDHEVEKVFFLEESEAIKAAEQMWLTFDELLRHEREVSVHQGYIEYQEKLDYQPRFVVQHKRFKAYKRLYVTGGFAKQYLALCAAEYQKTHGMDEQEALAEAKKGFNRIYEIQPKVAYGMFADYQYAPKDWRLFP